MAGDNETVGSFDWSLLRSFLAVVDAGSLLGAARRLNKSQPTIGRHIDALEEQLETSLFERTGRGLRPTEAAISIVQHARAMETTAAELCGALSKRSLDTSGTVRITTSRAAAAYLMPPLIVELRERAPEIQIELVASDKLKNLLRREADIAIRMARPTQSGLVARRIADAVVGAFAHRRYLKKHGTPRVPIDLLAHSLIGYDSNDAILRGFRKLGANVSKEAFVLRSDDVITHWQAIRAGLGIGFTTTYVASRDSAVVRVLPNLPLPALPVWLVCHRELQGTARFRLVYDFLAEALPVRLAALG